MGCSRGRSNPDNTTKLRLFSDSGGYCQNPSCLQELFLDISEDTYHIAEMAHIFSAADTGPRADKNLTAEERGSYDNLVLLCCNCHEIIDKAEDKFPDTLIKQWKKEHKARIDAVFKCPAYGTREVVLKHITPILTENKLIFNTYGPNTEERYNPESSLPKEWKNKIMTKIIPNNRKLLGIIDANYDLLRPEEIEAVELLRQHIHDFETKHLLDANISGIQFPTSINAIFKE